jgi:hypothetical protein
MALIKCSECGKEFSDKSPACPNCGCPVSEMKIGSDVPIDSSVKSKKKSKKWLIIIQIIILLICCCVGGFLFYQHRKQEDQKAKAEAERTQYIDNLNSFAQYAVLGASKSEETCNLIKSVWYNTIYKQSDSSTDKYTKKGFSFNEDFNNSLKNLMASDTYSSSIAQIKKANESVDSLYKKLQSPPEEFEKCFDVVDKLYDSYSKFSTLATDPSGNLQQYSDNFEKLDSDTLSLFDKLKTLIPDK